MSTVFIVLQANEETRAIVDALEYDNPQARIHYQPAMVRIEAPERLLLRRSSLEAITGRPFDLQSLHVHLVTLGGHVDEDEDQLSLCWHH